MNGTESRIEIFKPFGEAFELTKKILFQPFDFKKWLVIGFAAFLASLSGGFQYQGNPFSSWNSRQDRKEFANALKQFGPIDELSGWIIALIVVGILIFLAVVVVLTWLGARGRFIFTDCIVHNRGAIVAPWKEYRVEGNSFFLFSLLAWLVLVIVVALAIFLLFLPWILHGGSSPPGLGFWITVAVIIFFILLIFVPWALISQFMVPIMYRQRCLSRQAFAQTIALIFAYPGQIVLYFLFLIVLGLAAAMISCLAVCLTCCIAAIPYVGTVVLLPIHVLLYGFALLFLRQFGSDYDVWAGAVQIATAPESIAPPLPPDAPPIQS